MCYHFLQNWRISGFVLAALALTANAKSPPPAAPFANVKDYGYMGWVNGLQSPDFRIQTSRYVLNYNHSAFGPTALGLLAVAPTEAIALQVGVEPNLPVMLTCNVGGNGSVHAVAPESNKLFGTQVVESGKFFQRRWQKGVIPGGITTDSTITGLETAAWPDRLSLVLRVSPTEAVTAGFLEMTLKLPAAYARLVSHGSVQALVAVDGSGFIVQPSAATAALTLNPETATLSARTAVAKWKQGDSVSVGLIIYPLANNVLAQMRELASFGASPVVVTATGLEPALPSLPVSYEKDPGFYRVAIPKGTRGDDGRMRARLRLENPTAEAQVVRLNFDGTPFSLPGISAVLRDLDGNPLGIPVQLSKNWHRDTPGAFIGPWFHGLTMLTVPAKSTYECELMMVGENWGGMPAASHSQLSVIGYGTIGGQQWDEAALGNRGEALCYDMENALTKNDFTDARPLWALNAKGERDWAINVGGGSVLRYLDNNAINHTHSRMRVRYTRYGPNLTEATFAGLTDDGAIAFSYSAGLPRADDCTRGLHHIRIDVKKDTAFSRLVFYQQAGDSYGYSQGDRLAYGYADQPKPVLQWQASGQRGIVGTPLPLNGLMPWAAVTNGPADTDYKPANHGFIVRSWKAVLNGNPVAVPYLQERRATNKVSILELVPPPEVTCLKSGDYVEIDLERIYIPRSVDNYGGPNALFRQALTEYDNDSRMILREAAGNRIAANAIVGEVEQLYPLRIRAKDNRAAFHLTGGVGPVPVTFVGLHDYRRPVVEEKRGETWVKIDQSVIGNDFWQCDFNAETGTWEITFNLLTPGVYKNVEALISSPLRREFRFQLISD